MLQRNQYKGKFAKKNNANGGNNLESKSKRN